MKLKLAIAALVLSSLASSAFAATIVRDARVVRVGSTNHFNPGEFFVDLEGGSGCAGVNFRPEYTGACTNGVSAEVCEQQKQTLFQRNFSLAMLAMSTGMKVQISNKNGDSCDGAVMIEVYK